MEIKDLESLMHITKEIEAQGYAVRSVYSEELLPGTPTLEIKLVLSRRRTAPAGDSHPPKGKLN
jgi:hypothetical protein